MTDSAEIDLFLEVLREIEGTRLVKSGALSDAFYAAATTGMHGIFSVSVPDDDDFRSFLLALRKLLLQGDLTNIDRAANVVRKRLGPGELYEFLNTERRIWRDLAEGSGPMKLIIDGTEYKPSDAFDLLIYSGPFHHDPEKRRKLESLGPHGAQLIRQQVNFYVVALVNYARALRHTIVEGRRQGLLPT
ncbi:hypothetical protein [Ilumatobacter coccineus]|uniref:Uncharacterized protein n=1 Tax=Ilumatobacter coccineus (strain NBRC 103263 / KCTC 29153 / YM16-304) TaxID=1313172 RepID=A0A6C7EDA3_ILUCY|nr:hypothetical protein [Ilumatobacter coccineus]BAN03972.1 hypothetical protein YM304_36580 [Ilumatobacter coccineus YM16-304]